MGDMQSNLAMNFEGVLTSFLAVYQIFSSENWTSVLYSSAVAEIPLGRVIIMISSSCFLWARSFLQIVEYLVFNLREREFVSDPRV